MAVSRVTAPLRAGKQMQVDNSHSTGTLPPAQLGSPQGQKLNLRAKHLSCSLPLPVLLHTGGPNPNSTRQSKPFVSSPSSYFIKAAQKSGVGQANMPRIQAQEHERSALNLTCQQHTPGC